ncbi:hypothetical protein BCY91_01350 [Pelobium manganitolerans]|uniref:SCP2 domain-containing protein n=1 Tax=Pelobium manganitolerans TaxID=1842495 RepID=A0A419SBU1_9SPHI|nr:hypothetical protein [Pelobium manganitolerans]RKD20292.1 hypothetical protein BCY91_01350 [Pelobium manganitolerans]
MENINNTLWLHLADLTKEIKPRELEKQTELGKTVAVVLHKLLQIFGAGQSLEELKHDNEIDFAGLNDDDTTRLFLLQQHIRYSLNKASLLQKELYQPVLKHILQSFVKKQTTLKTQNRLLLEVQIVGLAGFSCFINTANQHLTFEAPINAKADAILYLDEQIAWLLFSGAVHLAQIAQFYQIIGEKAYFMDLLNFRVALFG